MEQLLKDASLSLTTGGTTLQALEYHPHTRMITANISAMYEVVRIEVKDRRELLPLPGTLLVSNAYRTSGTKSIRLSRSSSWSLSEIPLTGPLWIRFIRCVTKPAILLRIRFDGMMATSSHTRLFVWKSIVKRE